MKIPEKAPIIKSIIENNSKNLLKEFSKIPLEYSRKWIEDYDYWTEFKYKDMPQGISPLIAWAKRDFDTFAQKVKVPLFSKGKGFFSYWLSAKVQKILYMLDREISQENPFRDLREEKENDKYLFTALIEESSNSSIIEGAATTRKQAKEFISSNKNPSNKTEWMLLNNFEAIKYIKTKKDLPLSVEMIREFHKILTRNTLKNPADMGRLRESPQDDDVVIDDGSGNVLHRPVGGAQAKTMLEIIINFINKEEENPNIFIHPIIKAIILHFSIAYIHPFVDGNGRTARALFYWYMLRKGYWMFEYISISRLVLKMQGKYLRSFLYSELSENDLTYFLNFHIDIIKQAFDDFKEYLRKKQIDFESAEPIFKKWPQFNVRQKDLLLNAIKNPARKYFIGRHCLLHNISYATGRADLKKLADLGLFSQTIQGKSFVFIPVSSLEKKLLRGK